MYFHHSYIITLDMRQLALKFWNRNSLKFVIGFLFYIILNLGDKKTWKRPARRQTELFKKQNG